MRIFWTGDIYDLYLHTVCASQLQMEAPYVDRLLYMSCLFSQTQTRRYMLISVLCPLKWLKFQREDHDSEMCTQLSSKKREDSQINRLYGPFHSLINEHPQTVWMLLDEAATTWFKAPTSCCFPFCLPYSVSLSACFQCIFDQII